MNSGSRGQVETESSDGAGLVALPASPHAHSASGNDYVPEHGRVPRGRACPDRAVAASSSTEWLSREWPLSQVAIPQHARVIRNATEPARRREQTQGGQPGKDDMKGRLAHQSQPLVSIDAVMGFYTVNTIR